MEISEVLRKCNGCRNCELACSFRAAGMFWPPASAVRVSRAPASAATKYLVEIFPEECDLCVDERLPRCQAACGSRVLDVDLLIQLREIHTGGATASPGI